MKQGQINADSDVQAPADVEAVLASRPKGERYTGLTAAQAAEAAAQNVLRGSVSPARVVDLATNFINALHGYAPNELPGAIKEIRDSIWREHFEEGVYRPHRTICGDIDHRSYIATLLSPSASPHILEALYQAAEKGACLDVALLIPGSRRGMLKGSGCAAVMNGARGCSRT